MVKKWVATSNHNFQIHNEWIKRFVSTKRKKMTLDRTSRGSRKNFLLHLKFQSRVLLIDFLSVCLHEILNIQYYLS